jgi:ABC-type lipoprotein release transport system permease subunit
MPGGRNAAPARDLVALWHGAAPSPFAGQRLAGMRVRSGWRLLAVVGLGMLIAVLLTSAIPQYDDLVANVQVQSTIGGLDPAARNVEIRAVNARVSASVFAAEDAAARDIGVRELAAFTQATPTHYYSADSIPLARLGTATYPVGRAEKRATFEAFDYAQAGPHMRMFAGRLPDAAPAGSGTVEALITRSMAEGEGLQLGDTLAAAFLGTLDHPITAKVVGIWEPLRPNENFWNDLSFDPIITEETATYPVLLDPQDYLSALAPLGLLSNAEHWVYYTDARRVSAGGLGSVADRIGRAREQAPSRVGAAGATSAAVYSGLPSTIKGLRSELALLAQPLAIVVALAVGLTLFFVVAMAELLVDDQAAEIASLKSRGASGGQLLGNYAGQALLVGAVAAVIGWQLAAPVARLLVHGFVPAMTLRQAAVTDAYLAGLADPRASIAPALASALLSVGAVLVAVQRTARADVLAYRREQGRATRQPLWRRLYLDVALAIICLLGYLDLGTFGGLGVRQQLGASAGTSPLLLVAPALLLVAGALLLLRAFPSVVAAVGRYAARRRGALGVLALAQLARAPRGPSRLAALLALALGLGLFALTVDGSLARNAASRAAYQTGGDMRLLQSGEEPSSVDQRIRAALTRLPGVRGVTPVYRANVNVNGSSDIGTLTANLLGVDPTSWEADAGAVSWRADYADAPLTNLLGALRQHAWRADALGGGQIGDARHPVWALVGQPLVDALHLRVGQRFPLTFGGGQTTPANVVVGAIVQQFPTLYPAQSQAGYLVASLSDATAAYLLSTQSDPSTIGPNEYWLRTDGSPANLRALRAALANQFIGLDLVRVIDRRQLVQDIGTNPIQVGMRGLLLLGAVVAATLALLGSVIQSALAARQRAVRFAVLRTLGMAGRQLARLLLMEQVVIFAFGLAAGTLLGALLALATLPYLQFGDTALDPNTLGVPPYIVAIDPLKVALFYAVLLVSVALALAVAAFIANAVGLGKALRLGED